MNADAQFKGDQDSWPGIYFTPKQLRSYMNIFKPNRRSEFNPDHTKKNVVFDNDVFDALFGFDEPNPPDSLNSLNSPDAPVITEEEVEEAKDQDYFDQQVDKYSRFIRKKLGIAA